MRRLSDTLIFDDEDYKRVMYLADYTQKAIYRRDGLQISGLRALSSFLLLSFSFM